MNNEMLTAADDLVTVTVEAGFVVYVEYRGEVRSTSQTFATYEAALAELSTKRNGLRFLSSDYTARVAHIGW